MNEFAISTLEGDACLLCVCVYVCARVRVWVGIGWGMEEGSGPSLKGNWMNAVHCRIKIFFWLLVNFPEWLIFTIYNSFFQMENIISICCKTLNHKKKLFSNFKLFYFTMAVKVQTTPSDIKCLFMHISHLARDSIILCCP